ncbi:hypothetical protein VTN00DRAFT_7671 [Thermoascus crustaceus]|uniref:uncharacterized protein n=1 Tax=Thermoascus crustaceus TaxID=5088 RepID=UPI0037426BB6
MSDLSDSAQSEEEEYLFDSRHADDIVRIASYHRKDFDPAVVWLNLRDHVDVKASMPRRFPRPFTNDLGILDTLPLEILHEICLHMDIASLFQFRQVSMRARSGWHAERVPLRGRPRTGDPPRRPEDRGRVVLHHPRPLHGALHAGLYSLRRLRRVHLPPYFHSVLLLVHPLTDGAATSRHAVYFLDERLYEAQTCLVAREHILLLLECWGNPEGYNRLGNMISMGAMVESPLYRFMAATALPYLDLMNKSNDNDSNNTNGRVENGVRCKGCQIALKKRRDRVYSREGFLKHFRWCRQAQKLWEASCEGKKDVGFFEERKVVMYSW